jgi:hypothetical protein
MANRSCDTIAVPLTETHSPAAIAVVRQVHVGVEAQLVQLVRFDIGDEPEIAALGLGLGGHGTRDQPPILAPGGEHGDLDAFNQGVQVLKFLGERGVVAVALSGFAHAGGLAVEMMGSSENGHN